MSIVEIVPNTFVSRLRVQIKHLNIMVSMSNSDVFP